MAGSKLDPMATAIGVSWASELVRSLRSDDRDIVGEWPGTLGEARMRIRVAFRRRIDPQLLDDLARVANLAARRGWHEVRLRTGREPGDAADEQLPERS